MKIIFSKDRVHLDKFNRLIGDNKSLLKEFQSNIPYEFEHILPASRPTKFSEHPHNNIFLCHSCNHQPKNTIVTTSAGSGLSFSIYYFGFFNINNYYEKLQSSFENRKEQIEIEIQNFYKKLSASKNEVLQRLAQNLKGSLTNFTLTNEVDHLIHAATTIVQFKESCESQITIAYNERGDLL